MSKRFKTGLVAILSAALASISMTVIEAPAQAAVPGYVNPNCVAATQNCTGTVIIVDANTTQAELDSMNLIFNVAAAKVTMQQEGQGCEGAVGSSSTEEGSGYVSPTGVYCPTSSSCSWICGVVHNRSGASLYLSRDSSSHWSCSATGPYGSLPNGSNSNTYYNWPDTDCFRSNSYWIYYRATWYAPGSWVRIYNHVWIY